MRRATLLLAVTAVAALFIGVLAGPVAAGGRSFEQANRNDGCFQAGPNAYWHCANPGQGQGAAVSFSVFDDEGENQFLGVESLRFTDADLSAVPCPKEGGTWGDLGGGVWACHHWKGKP